MKYTLIEMVQRILESMDSDEVNSIADTTEALAVANIIKESYFNLVSEHSPKQSEDLFHLDAGTDNTKPTLMRMPSNAVNIIKLRYNIAEDTGDVNLRTLDYLPVFEFMDLQNNLDITQSWVGSQMIQLKTQSFLFKYRNDCMPQYYTSPDDTTILFDAVQTSVENTNTSVRTYAYGLLIPVWQMEDTFVPELDARQFQLLLNSAKAQAFIEMKQTTNDKAERRERRANALAYKTDDSTDTRPAIKRFPGFGRRTLRI